MRRSALLPATALLTFLTGAGAAWACRQSGGLAYDAAEALVPGPSPDEVGLVTPELSLTRPEGSRVTDGLRVTFLRMQRDESGLGYAAFLVTNERAGAVHYLGRRENAGGASYLRQGGSVINLGGGCATGLLGQTLLPGQSATFYARVPDTKAEFAAGFVFFVQGKESERTEWLTVWSGAVLLPSA